MPPQIPASRGVQTQKLDEILQKLEGQPSIDDWHSMATMLTRAVDRLDDVSRDVCQLTETINGNGKPGLKADVIRLKDGMDAITKITWIVVGVVVSSAVGTFIYLANTHVIP